MHGRRIPRTLGVAWHALLDLFLGSDCASCGTGGPALCSRCRSELPRDAHSARPTPCPEGLVPVLVAGAYDGVLRELIVAHKERARFALADPLGRTLVAPVRAVLRCVDTADPPRLILVPVPSARAAVRRRGHDPVLRMTRIAAGQLRSEGYDVGLARALKPSRRVADQSGLDAAGRGSNLSGALRAGRLPPGSWAVVVDDIVTTGSTAREAQRALEAAGTTVVAVVALAATQRRSLPPSVPPSLPYVASGD